MKKPQTDLRVSFCQPEFRRQRQGVPHGAEFNVNTTKVLLRSSDYIFSKKKAILISHFYC